MSYTNLRVHFIWSTHHRKPFLRESLRDDLFAYIGGILRKRDHTLMAAGGVEDHIHLLVGMHQSQSIADCVCDVKSNSSRWMHDNHKDLDKFKWQTKYGAFSVSQSGVEEVTAYIANQQEHHRTMTFQEEFVMFLRKHGITFDERYVFE